MVFHKGISGNPSGRPGRDHSISGQMRALLATKKNGRFRAQIVADAVLTLAESGDVQAVRLVLERMEGKVIEQIDVTGEAAFTFMFAKHADLILSEPSDDDADNG